MVVGGEMNDVVVDVFVAFVGGFGVGNGSGEGGAFVEGAIHALHVSVTQIHVMRRNHGVTRRNNHVTVMYIGMGRVILVLSDSYVLRHSKRTKIFFASESVTISLWERIEKNTE